MVVIIVHTSLHSKHFHGVWEQSFADEGDFQCFARGKNGARAKKNGKRGVGKGKGGNACKQTSSF